MASRFTSKDTWELFLSSVTATWDGADHFVLGTFDEMENYGYKVKVFNNRTLKDISQFLTNITLDIPDNADKISSMKASFSLEDRDALQQGDEITVEVVNGAETARIEMLRGKVKLLNKSLNSMYHQTLQVEVADEIESLFDKVVAKDIFVFDKYIYSEQYKENSILYMVAKNLGFTDEQMDFEDVRDSQSRLIKVPFMLLKKDNRYVDELQTILEVTKGRIYIDNLKKIVFKNGLFDYKKKIAHEFDTRNILNGIETTFNYSEKNGVRVIYDSYKFLKNQVIFDLAKKVEVEPSTTSASQKLEFNIKYITDLAVQHNITAAEGYYYVGEEQRKVSLQQDVHYEVVEFKESSAKIKFLNPYLNKLYIDKFEIKGVPLVKYSDNEVSVKTKKDMLESEENFVSYTMNKYIQTEIIASDVAKQEFIKNCKNKMQFNFKTNFAPHLEPGDVCTLKVDDLDLKIEIDSISHNLTMERGFFSNITATEYEEIEQEFNYTKIESITASDKYLENLNNIKDKIDETEEKLEEVVNAKGAKGFIDEFDPRESGKIVKDRDIWYNPKTKEFKMWLNGRWNPAIEDDIPPALMTALKAQAGVLRIGGNDVEAGIFFQYDKDTKNPVFGAADSENLAQVSIDKKANVLIRNANNKMAFNMRDPENPGLISSQLLMGVYNADDEKHRNTLFQIGDESTGTFIKFERMNRVAINIDGKEVKQLIEDSKKDALDALEKLDKMASDGWFTAAEKVYIEKEYEELKNEYFSLLDRALTYSVPTDNIDNKYNTLKNYIDPMFNSENFFKDTAIVRDEFNSKFSEYYTSKIQLLVEIEERIKLSAIQTAEESSKVYADKVIKEIGDDLTAQIDGKINTYNQETDPSLSWLPEDKIKNTGDLWYKESEQKTRRWSGTAWHVLSSSDSVSRELAMQKRRIFTAQPFAPYDAGDLWMTDVATGGDMKVCVQSLVSGTFNSVHWKKATKYTDDTTANLAIEKANKAVQDASGAIGMMEDLSKDSKFTPSEKQQTKKEMEIINTEYTQTKLIAESYNVGTQDYTTRYNALKAYIDPLLNNMISTSDIQGAVFREKFTNYYDGEMTLTKLIYEAVKNSSINQSLNTDTANRILDSDLKNTELYYKGNGITAKNIEGHFTNNPHNSTHGALEISVQNPNGTAFFASPNFALEAGTYTVSMFFKEHSAQSGGKMAQIQIGICHSSSRPASSTDITPSTPGYLYPVAFTGSENPIRQKIVHTFEVKDNWYKSGQLVFFIQAYRYFNFEIATLKLEKHGSATQWTRCPSDGVSSIIKLDKKVDDFLKDGSLSEKEKTILKADIDILQNEKNAVVVRASQYSISCVNLESKFTALLAWRNGILSQPGNYTGDTTVFRNDLKSYSLEKEEIIKQVDARVKLEITDVTKKVDDFASDGVLTPGEKALLKTDIDLIRIERVKLLDRAYLLGAAHPADFGPAHTAVSDFYNNVLIKPGTYTGDVEGFKTNLKRYSTAKEQLIANIEIKAKELADKAQKDANGALGLIFDIASDGKITPSEKIATKKEWDIIVSEFTKNVDQAKLYAVDYTMYSTKYNNLNSYLSPLLQDLSTTSDINGGQFRLEFKYYYDQRLLLLNAISAKIKAAADAAQDTGDTALENQTLGKITISADTVYKGNARFESAGDSEATLIERGKITFTRNGKPLTVIKNIKYGTIDTNANGSGYVDFTDMNKNLFILTSLQRFDSSTSVASIRCYCKVVDIAKNRWQFYIGGMQTNMLTNYLENYNQIFTYNCYTIQYKSITLECGPGSSATQGRVRFRDYYYYGNSIREPDITPVRMMVKFYYSDGLGSRSLIYSHHTYVPLTYEKVMQSDGSWNARLKVLGETFEINQLYSTTNSTNKTMEIEYSIDRTSTVFTGWDDNGFPLRETLGISADQLKFKITSKVSTINQALTGFAGTGTIQYIAMEP